MHKFIGELRGNKLDPDHYAVVTGAQPDTSHVTMYFPVSANADHEALLTRIRYHAGRSVSLFSEVHRLTSETARRHIVLARSATHSQTPFFTDVVELLGGRTKKKKLWMPGSLGLQVSVDPDIARLITDCALSIEGLVQRVKENPISRSLSHGVNDQLRLPRTPLDRPDLSAETQRFALRIRCYTSFPTDAKVLATLQHAHIDITSVRCRIVNSDGLVEMILITQDASEPSVVQMRTALLNLPEVSSSTIIPVETTHQHVQIVSESPALDARKLSAVLAEKPHLQPHASNQTTVLRTSALPSAVATARRACYEAGLPVAVNSAGDGRMDPPPRAPWSPYSNRMDVMDVKEDIRDTHLLLFRAIVRQFPDLDPEAVAERLHIPLGQIPPSFLRRTERNSNKAKPHARGAPLAVLQPDDLIERQLSKLSPAELQRLRSTRR